MPSALIVVMDGVGAGQLGPYGNTWVDTPAFNRLAAESVLAEYAWATDPAPVQGYDHVWRAGESGDIGGSGPEGSHLLSLGNSHGTVTKLLTDDPDLLEHRFAAGFTEQIRVEGPQEQELASEWDKTHTARFFAEAIRALQELPPEAVLWVHTRALGNPWDAPKAYRERFADDDDPLPSDSSHVPHLELDPNYDPDDLHSIQCACAGQVVLLDQCFGGFLTMASEIAARREMLLAVTSTRGFPLGEHLIVGWDRPCVYRELLHVPMFFRYPDSRYAMQRAPGLMELGDLVPVVSDWLTGSSSETLPELRLPKREFSISRNAGEILLRTRAWHARFPRYTDDPEADVAACQLFLRPDDQLEVNDVSNRCPQVSEAARRFLNACLQKRGDDLPVPELLRESPP